MTPCSILRRQLLCASLCGLALLSAGMAHAASNALRMGTLAPKNSVYHRQLQAVGEAWRSAQGGDAKYLIYPDGSQGGEAELVRRMRIVR